MSKESLISRVGRVAATAGVVVGLGEVGLDTGRAIGETVLERRGLLTEERMPTRTTMDDIGDGLIMIAVSAAVKEYLSREEE